MRSSGACASSGRSGPSPTGSTSRRSAPTGRSGSSPSSSARRRVRGRRGAARARSAGTAGARSARTPAGPRPPPTRCCRCSPATRLRPCRCRPGSPRIGAASATGRAGSGCRNAAHAPWLDPLLEEAGVRATCVELTAPSASATSATCGRCRPTTARCCGRSIGRRWRWCGASSGYPAAPAYRDYHALTAHHHRAWGNDGGAVRPRSRARRSSPSTHGTSWSVSRQRVAATAGSASARSTPSCSGTGGTRGCDWLAAVVDEAARQGLALTTLDDALERHEPVPAPAELP